MSKKDTVMFEDAEVASNEVAFDHPVVNENGNMQMTVNIDEGELPDLEAAKEIPIDLVENYWTPERIGESKRVFFDCIKIRMVPDKLTGEAVELPCAYFFEKVNGEVNTVTNGSKRLVGVFENGKVKRLDAVQITYMGKKKNVNGPHSSDSWSIKMLSLNV